MTDMTLKHTVSPSGKTHRLTDPKSGASVQLAYTTKPRFFDQVQGDLIRKFSSEIFPVVIGMIPVHIDPGLQDRGEPAPNLDHLRGFLAGMDAAEITPLAEHAALVARTREQIARLEAQRGGLSLAELASQPPTSYPGGGPITGALPADDALSQALPLTAARRAAEGVRRVRDAERNGW